MKNIKWLLVFCCVALFAGCMGYVNRKYLPDYGSKIPTVKSIELGRINFAVGHNIYLWEK